LRTQKGKQLPSVRKREKTSSGLCKQGRVKTEKKEEDGPEGKKHQGK